MTISLAATNRAEAQPSCDSVLAKCDAALAAKNKHIEKLELGLTKQTERVADLSNQVQEANEKLQSPFRNPFIVGTVGVALGILIMGIALK